MSKRQDRQGVRTPTDVERKYNLGGLRDMMSRIAAQASNAEGYDALSKEVEALEKVVENTASEMWQTQGEMQESLGNMQDDMTIVKQDFLNTAADVDDLKEDMTPLAEFSDGEYSGVVGFVARANADSATIATLLEFSQDDDITLAMFMAEASKEFATIESLTLLENKNSQAIAGVKQEASETYATIAMLSSYVDKEAQTEALAAFRQESNSKYATQQMLTGYVSDSEQTEALAGLRQEADGKYATQEMLTGYVSEKDQTEALAGLRQEVSDTYATQEMLSSYVSDTEQAQAIAGLKQEVSGVYATQEMLTQLELASGKAVADLRTEVSENYASVSQIAEVVDEHGKVTAAAIVAQINEGKSSILLSADAIDLEGYVTIAGLEGGTTTIDGACIKTGKIDADRIDATELKVDAANVTGTLVIGQLPSTVAETSDIPTNVSELTNDSGFQNESGVTSIVEGTVTTDFVNALGITAKRIDVDSLSAISANIGEVTAGIIRSENPFSVFRIDLTNGTMDMQGLHLDASGNLSVEGEIRAKSGYIGSASEGFAINSKYISGNGKSSYNGGTDNGVYIGADGIGLGRGTFWVNEAGYLHSESGSIGTVDIDSNGLTCGTLSLDDSGIHGSHSWLMSGGGTSARDSVSFTTEGIPEMTFVHEEEHGLDGALEEFGRATYRAPRGASGAGFIVITTPTQEYTLYLNHSTGTVEFLTTDRT